MSQKKSVSQKKSSKKTINEIEIKDAEEGFIEASFLGVNIFMRKSDGYVSATKIAKDHDSDIRQYFRGAAWKRIEEYWEKNIAYGKKARDVVKNGPKNGIGTYIHPDLVHFVAETYDMGYAFRVVRIMNGMNRAVHAELREQGLDDTAENSGALFEEIVELFDDASNCLSDCANEMQAFMSGSESRWMFDNFNFVKGKINKIKTKLGKPVDPVDNEDDEENEEEKVDPTDIDEEHTY
jgi:hypothetical protein